MKALVISATEPKQKQVLVLSNLPSPYLSPVFSHLAEIADWQLKTFYVAAWNEGVGWPFANAADFTKLTDTILSQKYPRINRWFGRQVAATVALFLSMFNEKYNFFLIYGYTQLPQVFLISWAIFLNIPFAIAGDANFYSDKAVGWKRYAKKLWLGCLTQHAAAIITIGKASRMFWEAYAASTSRLFQAGFSVDNDFFYTSSIEKKTQAFELKHRLGWEGRTVFIYVGRLIERKNVRTLVSAMARLSNFMVALLIVGEGEDREHLELLANQNAYIHFTGAATQTELSLFYSLSDVLVLPAREEPWGLVINEAMASGLAVISHQYCGAALDLVTADNGLMLQGFSVEELTAAISYMAQDPKRLIKLKQHSLEKIDDWSSSQVACRLNQIISLKITKRS
jgi:glycosyltransferase involved in cell wall biosynthesis